MNASVERAPTTLEAVLRIVAGGPNAASAVDQLVTELGVNTLFHLGQRLRIAHIIAASARADSGIVGAGSPFEQVADFAATRLDAHVASWEEVGPLLAEATSDVVLLKSLHFAHEWGHGAGMGFFTDVDILTTPAALPAVEQVFATLGFRQGPIIQDNELLVVPAARRAALSEPPEGFGQTWPWARPVELCHPAADDDAWWATVSGMAVARGPAGPIVLDMYDVHHSVNFYRDGHNGDRPTLDDVFNYTIYADVGTVKTRVMDDTTLAWFLPYRLYHEVVAFREKKLKLLADLVAVARRARVDWDRVCALAVRYDFLRPALHHVYAVVAAAAPEVVPAELLAVAAVPSDIALADFGPLLSPLEDHRRQGRLWD